MGHGADSFHGTLHNLRRDVRTAAGAHTDYASALYAYVSEQESAKTQAQSLAQDALAARQAHTAALNANDHARAAAVQSELDGLVRRAQALQAHLDEVAGQAARRIDAAAERAPYAPPGWLEQAWDGLESAAEATWHFVTSPEFLHGLSTVLSVVSAVCAFIPGLQGVALVAAALSIVTDVLAQVAAGQPVNWLMVGFSTALILIPGGRVASLFRGAATETEVAVGAGLRTGAFMEGAAAGGKGLGSLEGVSMDVTEEGVSQVENHLAQFGEYPPNDAMVARLRTALQNGEQVSGGDVVFYTHELTESVHMEELMQQGMPFDDAYDVAHSAALAKYGVSRFSVYAPEVVQQFPEYFNDNWRAFWGIK